MLAIGDVLGDFGQEIQRVEDLEVARGSGLQFLVARFGEAAHGVVLGLERMSKGSNLSICTGSAVVKAIPPFSLS